MPSIVMSATVLRDIELVLDGVLGSGHVLGGAVRADDRVRTDGRVRPAGVHDAPEVVLPLTDPRRTEALAAGEAVLVDEEMTPIARLVGLAATDGGVRGTVTRERRRESGAGRAHLLTVADRVAGWGRVAVLARPVTAADSAALHGVEAIVVPDDAADTAGVPTDVMLRLAHRLAERLATAAGTGEIPVRTAPLPWRDPVSDAALTDLLGEWLGGADVVRLSTDSGDAGAAAWASLATALDERHEEVDLDHDDADILQRWRRPRSSRGVVLMLSGLSGSGKSTVARGVAARLAAESDRTVSLLDGDVVRQMLSSGLGFDRASRILNVRRIGYVGSEIARHGGIAICAPIAPYATTRAQVRAMAEAVGDFILVHVSTPLAECERRDLKGLYAKARAGLIPEFTGISDPYDVPTDADLRVDTSTLHPAEAVGLVLDYLVSGGWVRPLQPTDPRGNA